MSVRRLSVILFISIISTQISYSYQAINKLLGSSEDQPLQEVVSDPYGRSTPRGTVKGFFKSLAKEDYSRASKYIDIRAFEKYGDSTDISKTIKAFENSLNRFGSVLPISVISDLTEGYTDDGIELNLEKVGSAKIDEAQISIFLEQLTTFENQKIWVFSIPTFSKLSEFDSQNEQFNVLNEYLPDIFSKRLYGGSINQWLLMVLIAIVSYLACWLFTFLVYLMATKIWKNYDKSRHAKILKTFLLPLRLVLTVVLLIYVSRTLEISIIIRQSFGIVNMLILWLAFFMFIWLLADTLFHFGEQKLRDKNKTGSLSAILFVRASVKFTLLAIAFIIILDTIGLDVTTGIAALGIGGIALALGAQKTIENLVGGVSVIFDQPVNVGDFCKFGETIGIVEKIGIRSTRIRTLNRTIVTIPNADFSSRLIENYAARDQFLFNTRIGLRYETSHDQMLYILKGLKEMLDKHEKVNPDPARVRFVEYGSDSLIVELFAYIYAIDWNDFLAIKEELNLKMAKVIEDSGSGFAFPSQTVYLSKDKGISTEIPSKNTSK